MLIGESCYTRIVDFYPAKGMFHPGETIQLVLELSSETHRNVRGSAQLCLSYLMKPMVELMQPFSLSSGEKTVVTFTWAAPDIGFQGFGADLILLDESGRMMASASTAFDVASHWTKAPRYGFLSEFNPNRADINDTVKQMAKYHINGIQFYDWQYRHDQPYPPQDRFYDPLGRELSLTTIQSFIESAHQHGMAAMPYTAVYAASASFLKKHPNWALFDAAGDPYVFDGDFLYIMNIETTSSWTEHLMRQFEIVLRETDFDGIHLDQYGAPRAGFDETGHPIDLAQALPPFIDKVKEVASAIKPKATVVFNAVKSWPLETVAGSCQDFVYIEVWPPRIGYQDLREDVLEAKRLSNGKPVVVAAYISPTDNLYGVLLVNAVLFAHGASHIELGEGNGMLADPYFPKYERMAPEVERAVRAYYDFSVRYGNLLYESIDNTSEVTNRLQLEAALSDLQDLKKVWVIGQRQSNYQIIHLINQRGLPDTNWTQPKMAPTPLQDLQIRYDAPTDIKKAYWASPDHHGGKGRELLLEDHDGACAVTLPQLNVWNVLVFEMGSKSQKQRSADG